MIIKNPRYPCYSYIYSILLLLAKEEVIIIPVERMSDGL